MLASHSHAGVRSVRTTRGDAKSNKSGTSSLKRQASWRCPREYPRRTSNASRAKSTNYDKRRIIRQPWGTIVPPSFEMGHQKMSLRRIDKAVNRLYYIPQLKLPRKQDEHPPRIELNKKFIDKMVGIRSYFGHCFGCFQYYHVSVNCLAKDGQRENISLS